MSSSFLSHSHASSVDVTIPTVRTRTSGSTEITVYDIVLNGNLFCCARFSDLHRLYQLVETRLPPSTPIFPPKQVAASSLKINLFSLSGSDIERRRAQLESWLRVAIFSAPSPAAPALFNSRDVRAFLFSLRDSFIRSLTTRQMVHAVVQLPQCDAETTVENRPIILRTDIASTCRHFTLGALEARDMPFGLLECMSLFVEGPDGYEYKFLSEDYPLLSMLVPEIGSQNPVAAAIYLGSLPADQLAQLLQGVSAQAASLPLDQRSPPFTHPLPTSDTASTNGLNGAASAESAEPQPTFNPPLTMQDTGWTERVPTTTSAEPQLSFQLRPWLFSPDASSDKSFAFDALGMFLNDEQAAAMLFAETQNKIQTGVIPPLSAEMRRKLMRLPRENFTLYITSYLEELSQMAGFYNLLIPNCSTNWFPSQEVVSTLTKPVDSVDTGMEFRCNVIIGLAGFYLEPIVDPEQTAPGSPGATTPPGPLPTFHIEWNRLKSWSSHFAKSRLGLEYIPPAFGMPTYDFIPPSQKQMHICLQTSQHTSLVSALHTVVAILQRRIKLSSTSNLSALTRQPSISSSSTSSHKQRRLFSRRSSTSSSNSAGSGSLSWLPNRFSSMLSFSSSSPGSPAGRGTAPAAGGQGSTISIGGTSLADTISVSSTAEDRYDSQL
ncbi:hypothetical protein H696_00093 [Fonticula alba]|uniref:PX domain-containing protein n=1 Tax=Fonticula alba TaxID=691883 RepID=A0A058ZEZ5_FONAL|nr:hypothetical protein H696_00093 [Fonticula alba]KCV72498.1 hypothetical protein H696_00093 [Fonticula alba]|eukprot:XP_009492199.1 hypothetical protein H696_00093 [Fonticula alba]